MDCVRVPGGQDAGYGGAMDYELDANGRIAIPDAPGMGHELDWEFIQSARVC